MAPPQNPNRSHLLPSRRDALRILAGGACCLAAAPGCSRTASGGRGQPQVVWGDRGNRPGHLQRPRAAAVDDTDRVYIADLTDRIQVFSSDGEFLHHWRLPDFNVDGPTGLSIDGRGNLLVADTHFYRILVYSTTGELIETIGGTPGTGAGEFGFVRDVVEDPDGYLYTCETGDGELERVQVLSPDRGLVTRWGTIGREPGQFLRPEALAFDPRGRLFVCDSCNHRIQVFSKSGELLDLWGTQGSAPGELSYPYDIAFDLEGNVVLCEYGNHRVQKLTPKGRSLAVWGRPGHAPGELSNPWGLAMDRLGRIHVVDTYNHRVQRMVL